MNLILKPLLLTAAAFVVLPGPAFAKDDIARRADSLAAEANRVQQKAGALANDAAARDEAGSGQTQDNSADRVTTEREEHHDFPWGLLGLLGLAGLLGLKKNDRNDGRTGGSTWDSTKDPVHREKTGRL